MGALDSRYLGSGTFSFNSPRFILYGRGAATAFVDRLAQALDRERSGGILVITDRTLVDAGVTKPSVEALESIARPIEVHAMEPREPPASTINALGSLTRERGPAAIVAIGGGSTIDSAKAARLLMQFGGRIEDYEGVDLVPGAAEIPLVAIATTSGTGSETGYAALYVDDATATKRFVGSAHLVPDVAVVDPELTVSVPKGTTASTGIDAIAQAIGPYLSPLRHPLTDVLALEAVSLLGQNLLTAYRNGSDMNARAAMAYGSLMMGLAMNNAECIGEHFFAEMIGPRYGLVHGVSVGMFLPYILQFNRQTSGHRLTTVSASLLNDAIAEESEAIDALIAYLVQIIDEVGLPTMREIGVAEHELDDLADLVHEHIGIKLGLNPRPLDRSQCRGILQAAYDEVPPIQMTL